MWVKEIFVFGLMSFATTAFATPLPASVQGVVVVSPGISLADAKAYATHHDLILLSDYLERSRPGDEQEQMLKKKLELAQRAWLGGEVELARTEFRALTELSLKADWRAPQREVLQTAYLRLAQSSESSTERTGWLESAVRLFGDLKPEPSLFPPPLLNEFDSIRKRLETAAIEIDLSEVFPNFRYVLLDGRKIEIALEPRVRIFGGLHRMTAMSDSHEAITEFLTGAQLRILRLSPPALTEGACGSAMLRSRAEWPSTLKVQIYSGDDCPTAMADALDNSRFISGPKGFENLSGEPPAIASKSHAWLWVVGAAVVAGAGYALASQSTHSSVQSVHRTGF